MRNKQGIFGGTFDPVHLGHIQLLETLLHKKILESIRLIPCHIPPHRPTPHASAEQRLEMLRLATQHLGEQIIIDNYEILQNKPSYTIDTLEYLQHTYIDTDFVLIMGTDAWSNFLTWHRSNEILQRVNLLVVSRDHDKMQHAISIANQQLEKKVSFFTDFNSPISATRIRQCLFNNEDCQSMLPSAVYEYIKKNKLYSEES